VSWRAGELCCVGPALTSNAERILHGVLRGRLDLLLGVGHARGEARDDVREAGGGLGRGLLHGDGDEVEGVDAALPVDGVVEHAEDHRHDERDSRAGGGHEGAAGVGGLVADALVAVGAEEDDGLKSLEQVRLSRGAHRGGKLEATRKEGKREKGTSEPVDTSMDTVVDLGAACMH
jgi:hypothetical protein